MPDSTAPDQPVLLLTLRDAAAALAVSERTLWQLAHDGVIPTVRIGRALRVDSADLSRFIAHQKQGGRRQDAGRALEGGPVVQGTERRLAKPGIRVGIPAGPSVL